jgi:glycosyltransferase involved in cell wall biosynthesis
MTRVTVAICTWNRSAVLAQNLAAMTELAVPRGVEWELLVVNNNCTDATDDVLAQFTGRLPLRRCFQPMPGLSHARNMAVAEATGDYIIWTDDDTIVEPGWLAAYSEAFAAWPGAALFGGPIEPWFPNPPPPWITAVWKKIANAYGAVDYGGETVPLTAERVPFGGNMAFRIAEQRAFPYDPQLGVGPGRRMGGEETAVAAALLATGATGWWVPQARLRHYVHEHHQTLAFLRSYFAAWGEYLARFEPDTTSPRVFGQPRWLWKDAVTSEFRYRLKRMTGSPDQWIDDFIGSSTARGRLRVRPPAR